MYRSDAEVEKDVEMLRRRLKEEPVERQVQIRRRSAVTHHDQYRSQEMTEWWVVCVHKSNTGENRVWFTFLRNSAGTIDVRPRTQEGALATVETVEAALVAGMMMVERPS